MSATFITDRSWLLFHLAGRNAEGWLQRAPDEWPQNPDYTFMSEDVRDMLVVNDCAERNIKAITDYNRCTQDVNGMLDNIVLVGEDWCSLIPNKNTKIFCVHKQTKNTILHHSPLKPFGFHR